MEGEECPVSRKWKEGVNSRNSRECGLFGELEQEGKAKKDQAGKGNQLVKDL